MGVVIDGGEGIAGSANHCKKTKQLGESRRSKGRVPKN